MDDLLNLWRLSWVGELGRHLARVLTPLLPDDRELLATGTELAIVRRTEDAPLAVAVTYPLPTPGEGAVLDAGAVATVLGEVQDEIALHLARAWPVSDSGAALTAQARPSGDAIALSFEPRSGDAEDTIVLPPFMPPPPLENARVAG